MFASLKRNFIQGSEDEEEEYEKGLDLKEAQEYMRKADEEDKKRFRERVKAKHKVRWLSVVKFRLARALCGEVAARAFCGEVAAGLSAVKSQQLLSVVKSQQCFLWQSRQRAHLHVKSEVAVKSQ
ncbi:hypothetical protein HOLleu_44696 [Holothuria leucospilota]|uniref:Uncharacterized protein n=1 Tax=Holothuria leucospilota TaxID=206669 RepID=A0A9Q0Y8N5_HOLLE|nr:hypothetical protein HOLleu_44696 [Holothuria leucospilota]